MAENFNTKNGGEAQRCVQCDYLEYPRQDPAVIVAITDEEDRLRLRTTAHGNRVSCRSLLVLLRQRSPEHAVVPEAKKRPRWMWKRFAASRRAAVAFPRSVMIGFTGKVSGTRIPLMGRGGCHEMDDARGTY